MADAFKCDCCGKFYTNDERYLLRLGPTYSMNTNYYKNDDAIYTKDLCETCATTVKNCTYLISKMYGVNNLENSDNE